MASVLNRIFHTFFPQSCLCCGGRLFNDERFICSSCMQRLPRPMLHNNIRDNELAHLFWGAFPIEGAAAAFKYMPDEILSHVVHVMKYGHNAALARHIGRIIAQERLTSQLLADADILVPMPITKRRRRERGYNQCEEICRGISEITGLPINANVLRRVKFSDSQTAMTRWERMENVRGAFGLGDTTDIQGHHIVIVDDIITTGSTIVECLRNLRQVPDVRVSVLSFAWTRY